MYDKSILGFMKESELKIIEQLATEVPKNGVIVEIGSCFGRSSVCWAKSAPTATVYCIDTFSDQDWVCDAQYTNGYDVEHGCPRSGVTYNTKSEFIRNTKSISNIVMIEGNSPHVIYPGGDIDLFFIDALHMNPNDWENLCHWIPQCKPNAVVCGHDMVDDFPDVQQNVRRLEKILNKAVTLYPSGTIWSFKLDRGVSRNEL
jgi:hypothetical protein